MPAMSRSRRLVALAAAALLATALTAAGCAKRTAPAAPGAAPSRPARSEAELRGILDAYLAGELDTDAALGRLAQTDAATIERLLRLGPLTIGEPPQPRGQTTYGLPLACDHVDHATTYNLYVPPGYDPAVPATLVIVGHGGNGAMPLDYATTTARRYIDLFTPAAAVANVIVAAPVTTRGWGPIGNSMLLTLIRKLGAEYRLDPDRIYVTGHSMGGHLTWRSGIYLGDRFGAIAPMSGGYDYVRSGEIEALYNVPGYGTFGREEPYRIDEFNRIMRGWLAEHGYDWVLVEKMGGHEIYADEIPKVYAFFAAHPRDLYPPSVFARAGGVTLASPGENPAWGKTHTWRADRPIDLGTFRWLRLFDPPPPDVPEPPPDFVGPPAPVPPTPPQRVFASIDRDENTIFVTATHTRKLRIYLHPRLVDLDREVRVVVNGRERLRARVQPDRRMLLELVREFGDRGRVFWASIDVALDATDSAAIVTPSRATP